MLVILSGVSGAGKDTIKKELIKRMDNVISLPSYTSRNPRPGEKEGVQYHFITKQEFEERIKNDEFEKTVQLIMTIKQNEQRLG